MFAYMLGKDYVNGIRRIAESECLGKGYESCFQQAKKDIG